jgi:hypothetical protein
VFREAGHAGRCRDLHFFAVDLERQAHCGKVLLGDAAQVFVRARSEQDGEFIVTQAPDQAVPAGQGAQPFRDAGDHLVAGGMAKQGNQGLQAVNAEKHEHESAAVAVPLDRPFELGRERGGGQRAGQVVNRLRYADRRAEVAHHHAGAMPAPVVALFQDGDHVGGAGIRRAQQAHRRPFQKQRRWRTGGALHQYFLHCEQRVEAASGQLLPGAAECAAQGEVDVDQGLTGVEAGKADVSWRRQQGGIGSAAWRLAEVCRRTAGRRRRQAPCFRRLPVQWHFQWQHAFFPPGPGG